MKKFTDMTMVSRILLVIEAAAIVIAGILCILLANGIVLKQSMWYFGILGFAVIIGLFWGLIALMRKIKGIVLKWIAGITLGGALFILASVVWYMSQVLAVWYGTQWQSVKAPTGETFTLIYQYYVDEEKLDVLYPDMSDEEVVNMMTADDYSIVFRAYPSVMGMFYKAEEPAESHIIQSADSDAQLLCKWRVVNETYPDGAFVWKAEGGWMVETPDASEAVLVDHVMIGEQINWKTDTAQAYIYLDPATTGPFDHGEIYFNLQ